MQNFDICYVFPPLNEIIRGGISILNEFVKVTFFSGLGKFYGALVMLCYEVNLSIMHERFYLQPSKKSYMGAT